MLHKLLARQLQRHGASEEAPPPDWPAFIDAIDAAYRQADADRMLLERSLDLCSEELTERYQLKLDVARRQVVERNLAASLALLRSILESSSDGILVTDQHARTVEWNQRLVDMWRLPDEIIASREQTLALEFAFGQVEDGAAILAQAARLEDDAEASTHDVLRLHDGRVFEQFSQPHRIEGATVGRVWTYRDITASVRAQDELRKSEEQLRQSQRLEAIGLLSGGIAHDFNNLLTAILGISELAMRTLSAGDPMHQYLEQIAGAGDRAAALTRQLLAFSRRQALQPRALDLNGVVSNMERLLRRVIGEDVHLVTIMAPDLALIEADPGQLEQVIMNLAVNARDAMPSGGTLTIETANIDRLARNDQEAGEPNGPGVLLMVTDTGHGMDEATRAHIFEPFYTTKEPGKGTGLGLSTVYGIVRQSGGNVFVESEPGRGASFRIALPVATAPIDEGPTPAHGASAEAGTESILVVEDDPGVRAVTVAMLQGLGYVVLEASGGAEALAVMEEIGGRIDLLFTDMVMPGIGGLELSHEMQARYPGLKVLYTSGFIPSTDPGQRSLPPQMAFLHKPFRSSELARKVREVLDQQLAE